ncbi:MAG: putative lipid II flippase FtsW [Clostridiales bacterium]|nr:putative lipid II flippase FtsW [Clostridiales bacterium]
MSEKEKNLHISTPSVRETKNLIVSELKSFWHELNHPKPNIVMRTKGGVDRTFLLLIILLLLVGTIMIFSSSYVYSAKKLGDAMYYVKRQTLYVGIGLLAMFGFSRLDYAIIKKLTFPLFIISYLMLAAVPVLGRTHMGATRWIKIGPIEFQPSETMKFALVLVLAFYLSYFSSKLHKFTYGILIPGTLIAIVCATTIVEHHMSGTIILFLLGLFMISIAGANLKTIAIGGGAFAGVALVIVLFTDYMKNRLDAWLHAEKYLTGKGWQPYQSLLAIGAGGLFGVGLGNSLEKYLWLPEPHNDFIFAILCEELGLIGALGLITLFLLLVWRGLKIARNAPDLFSSYLVLGLICKVFIQFVLNIAVVTSSIPTTGISLPFISYGGTALLVQLGEMGIVLSISRYKSTPSVSVTNKPIINSEGE